MVTGAIFSQLFRIKRLHTKSLQDVHLTLGATQAVEETGDRQLEGAWRDAGLPGAWLREVAVELAPAAMALNL